MRIFMSKTQLQSILLTGLVLVLVGCSAKSLSPTSSKGATSTKAVSTLGGQGSLDVLNTSSGKKVRMAWEGAQEVSKNATNVSISPDQRGTYGVYCFGNETDCRQANSDIRGTKVGTSSYGDNPVAITALELQFKDPVASGFSVELITAIPVMMNEGSHADMWFYNFKKLSYTYNGSNSSLIVGSPTSDACTGTSYGYLPPAFSPSITDASVHRSIDGVDYYRGARLFTGFGILDHGTPISGVANAYEFGRMQFAKIYHLGMAPSATGGLFVPTYIPEAYTKELPSDWPWVTAGVGLDGSKALHKIGYQFVAESNRPSIWQRHVVVGLCIRNSPIKSMFYRNNLFKLKDCSVASEGCN